MSVKTVVQILYPETPTTRTVNLESNFAKKSVNTPKY